MHHWQEMANPRIRPHIRHYPEDAGHRLEQCWQGQHWLNEMDASLTTPMLRVGTQDFYIFEPTKLKTGSLVIPHRWFTRTINGQELFFAKAWPLMPIVSDSTATGYLVHECSVIEVAAADLLLSFPRLLAVYQSDGIPNPCNIIGM